jgi:hypothetical protein
MKAAAAAGLDINPRWIEFRFSRVSKQIHEAELAIYGWTWRNEYGVLGLHGIYRRY